MGHTPFGYRIENGKAVIDGAAAEKIRKLFRYYIFGLSLTETAKKAELYARHGTAGRMLKNQHYLGDDYYPAIIDEETFKWAEEERFKRAKSLGRIFNKEDVKEVNIPIKFKIIRVTQKYINPFKQAEYAYSLIEMAVNTNE